MTGDDVSREVAETGFDHLQSLFGRPLRAGCDLAVQAAEGLEAEDTIRQSCVALTADLIAALR